MIITKYFDAESQLKNYNKGSFRLGTLIGYASHEEGEGDRFSDNTEGTAETHFGAAGETIEDLKIGSASFQKITSFPPAPPGSPLYDLWKENSTLISYRSRLDSNVFCASIGPYDLKHHRAMRYGVEDADEPYRGNPELTGWVEIDVAKFISALKRWVQKNSDYPEIRAGQAPFLLAKEVLYSKKPERKPVEEARNAEKLTKEMIDRLVFQKPKRFAPEREFRIAVSMHPLQYTSKTKPIFPQSYALQRSIVRRGRVKR
ncbi:MULTISPECIES: hypothetical protein [Salipiger]|uniref:hypothetical protein n=1 Tax=Salipiger TaxID=263377 RepID=UPI0035186B2C